MVYLDEFSRFSHARIYLYQSLLWFHMTFFIFQGVQCKDCRYNAHKKCSEKVPKDCTGEIPQVRTFVLKSILFKNNNLEN